MQRVILLGASNVTLAFPLIVEGLRRSLPEPIELFAAHGHGRSYGLWSRVLMRRLPGIRECGLWESLATRSGEGRPLALVTDVGNDLLFGGNGCHASAGKRASDERSALSGDEGRLFSRRRAGLGDDETDVERGRLRPARACRSVRQPRDQPL